MNRLLKKRLPKLPVDSDQLILVSTKEGAIIVMLKTTIVRELQLDFVSDIQQLSYIGDALATEIQIQPIDQNTDEAQRNLTYFQAYYNSMNNQQEQSAGYLILTSTQGIHFYGLRIFEFLRFMVKAYYPATTNWERQLDPERLLIHLMSYNAASVLD